jgi:hypothetical protein
MVHLETRKNTRQDNHKKVQLHTSDKPTNNSLDSHFPKSNHFFSVHSKHLQNLRQPHPGHVVFYMADIDDQLSARSLLSSRCARAQSVQRLLLADHTGWDERKASLESMF